MNKGTGNPRRAGLCGRGTNKRSVCSRRTVIESGAGQRGLGVVGTMRYKSGILTPRQAVLRKRFGCAVVGETEARRDSDFALY